MMRFPRFPSLFLALGVAALASCGRGEVAPPSKLSGPCSSLTRLQCYASQECFLDHAEPNDYSCRDKRGPCEVDMRQTDEAACRARPGCEWDPGSCFCPFPGYGETSVPDPPGEAGGACACGGGPPPRCEQRNQPAERSSDGTPPAR